MTGITKHKLKYQIFLDGQEMKDLPLITLSISNEINRIPKAKIKLYHSVEYNAAGSVDQPKFEFQKSEYFNSIPTEDVPQFVPGQKIEIRIGNEKEEPSSLFEGRITKQRLEADNNSSVFLFIECKHEANKLTLFKRTRVLHHLSDQADTDSDGKINAVEELTILKKLIENNSNLTLKWDNEVKELKQENLVQYNCSDWDFLITRAEIHGLVCMVDSDQLILTNPKLQEQASYQLKTKENLVEFEAEYNEVQQADQYNFSNWVSESDDTNDSENKNNSIGTNKDSANIKGSQDISYGAELEQQEINQLKNNLEARQNQGLLTASATIFGTSKINLLDTVEIEGFKGHWDGKTIVSSINHVLYDGKWHTYLDFGLSSVLHQEKFDIGSNQNPFIPPTAGLIYGKVEKYVKAQNGNEMVQVSIASASTSKDQRTIFARLSTPSGGKNGGVVFRPDKDDEVIIGFIENDPRFPVILGSLFNGNNTSPYSLEKDGSDLVQKQTGFSFFEGWNLSLHSEDNLLSISSPKGLSFELTDDGKNSKSITMKYDDSNAITIDKDGISIKGSKITMDAGTGNIEMSSMTTKINSDNEIALESTQLSASAKAMLELSGSITQVNS